MVGRWLRGPERLDRWHDAGLQAERTAMAWERTALGVGGVSAMLLHGATGSFWTALPGMVGLTASMALLVFAQLRYERTVQRVKDGLTPAAPAVVLALALTVLGLAVMSLALIIVEGSP